MSRFKTHRIKSGQRKLGSNSDILRSLMSYGKLTFFKDFKNISNGFNADFSIGLNSYTFARAAGSQTYYDDYGNIKSILDTNYPRHTSGYYDDTGFKKYNSFVSEFATTNLLTYSYTYSNAAWDKTNINVNSNPDLVEAGGYNNINTGTSNWGNETERHFLNNNQQSRIRQSGIITKVRLYTGTLSAHMTSFYFEVWRKDGSTWDRISQEDIIASLSNNTNNLVTLATPVTVQDGDYIGYGYTGTDSAGSFLTVDTGKATNSTYFVTGETPESSNYAWDTKTSSNSLLPIKVYMAAPTLICFGDSIMAGHTPHYSYIENSTTDSKESCLPYKISSLLGYTYQNMGIGGQGTTSLKNRFTNDVVNLKPTMAILEGGVNDIILGTVSQDTFLSNWTTILDACETNNITPIVLLMTPWTNGTNSQMQTLDLWNSSLKSLVEEYVGSIVVDASSYVGEYRAGGDDGNLWNIQSDYTTDGIHFNSDGYEQIADAINNTMLSFNIYESKYPDLLIATDANGTILRHDNATGQTYSVFIKRKIGTGKIYITADSGSNYSEITVTSDWCRFQVTASSASQKCGIKIETSGDAIYALISQYENLPYATTPIPTTTDALSRAGELLGYYTNLNCSDSSETIFIKFKTEFNSTSLSGQNYILNSETDNSGDRNLIFISTDDVITFYVNYDDSSGTKAISTTKPSAFTSYVVTAVAYGENASVNVQIYVNGISEGSDSDNYTKPKFGSRFFVGASNSAATGQLSGMIQYVIRFSKALNSKQIYEINNILNNY